MKVSKERNTFSRRGFLKGMLSVGAAAAFAGCGKSSDSGSAVVENDGIKGLSEDIYYEKEPIIRYGASTHNCGGRCITRAQVKEGGRIVRFLTDETKVAYDGVTSTGVGPSVDSDNRNCTQSRACGRCRAYKGRLYHPGRLKFPLKQTKARGDMSGFVRVSWQEALTEIVDKLKAVQQKYGNESFHSIYACGNAGSAFQAASYDGVFSSYDWDEQAIALRLLGGSSTYSSDYSFHQGSYMGDYGGIGGFSGLANMPPTADDIAGVGKFIVLWGSNIPTTHNPVAFSWIKGIEDMKKRDAEAQVLFIGPELSECGIAFADKWIRIKPYTDVALIHAMLYEMIVQTFKEDGTLQDKPWLDVDYIDTMVYGFFDSPGYWLKEGAGDIDTITPAPKVGDDRRAERAGGEWWRYVDAVPAGRSLSAYILGNDRRLTKADYGVSNYVSASFGGKRNGDICSYHVPANTKYQYKKDMLTPKTPEWAEKITGIPAAAVRELAKFYAEAGKAGQPIWNEWSGGMLKQAEGCTTLFAIQSLLAVTGNWGFTGTGIANKKIGPSTNASLEAKKAEITRADLTPASWTDGSVAGFGEHPIISVTQWHNAIKYAFGDKLKANGYKPNIPDWTKGTNGKVTASGKAYQSDGGVKSLVKRGLTVGGEALGTFTDTKAAPNRTYFEYSGRGKGGQTYSGYRFILNSGGNIPINQHMNCVDSARMYECLPTYGYKDNRRNVADKADAFYLVTFDNFMSPSARYSDYVLPAKTAWEQADFVGIENGAGNLYMDAVVPPPGSSISTWEFARELVKVYGGIDAAVKFTGESTGAASFQDVVKAKYSSEFVVSASKTYKPAYKGKSWEEFLKKPILHSGPSTTATAAIAKSDARAAYEVFRGTGAFPVGKFYPDITSIDTERGDPLFGRNWFAENVSCPNQSKRFHVYSGSLVWRYENLYSKWHGHLPLSQQGQYNHDEENGDNGDNGRGDQVVYPIPMYFAYEDYFRVAYGLNSTAELKGRYLLTTTHDRFRAHSSQAENPYLRELTHRVIGGALYSGNDSGSYAVSSSAAGEAALLYTPLNSLIGADGKPLAGKEGEASYMDIWVNDEDFKNFKDGELVAVYNEIGAVFCTLRKTKRCVRGYVGLHQGAWFDPRKVPGAQSKYGHEIVDVGGNCNTLMASKPSRIDHGNAQQSAMVRIERV